MTKFLSGSGDDVLDGEGGLDIFGGGGDDVISGGPRGNQIGGGPGDDRLSGNGGNDLLVGGEGDDEVRGGPGSDRILGGEGDDRLGGEAGNDMLAGEGGADLMAGGNGEDLLRAGRQFERGTGTRGAIDLSADVVDCGPGGDIALANRWDQVSGCERRYLVRLLGIGGARVDRATGVATLSVRLGAPGHLEASGPDLRATIRRRGATNALVRVRARGAALRTLRQRGSVTVSMRFSYRPKGQIERSEGHRVTLYLHRRSRG